MKQYICYDTFVEVLLEKGLLLPSEKKDTKTIQEIITLLFQLDIVSDESI